MTREELHRLVEEYREGTISVPDAERLAEAIRSSRAVAEAVRKELAFSGHLGQALDGADEDSFARSFSERLTAERGRDEFMTAFRKRSSAVRPRTRRAAARPSIVPFLVAAGFLAAILAAVVWQGRPRTPIVVVVEKPLPPPPPEAPKPERSVVQAPPSEPPVKPPEPPKPPDPPPVPPEPPVKPPDPPPPPPAPEEPKAPPARPTEVQRTAVAKLDRAEGGVFVVLEGDRKPAKAGLEIAPGMSVITAPRNGTAAIVLADGTRITLGADATIREIARGPKGTRVFVALGTVTADVAKQPLDQPLTFASPHGEAKVVGTVLRLVVDSVSTRLEVKEGKVQLVRDGRSAVVSAGQYAVAGAGTPMTPRSMSADEIVLQPHHAKLTGAEWLMKPDLQANTKVVLEAQPTTFKVVDHVETRPSYATFTFFAPADKEYQIWLRVASQEKGDPWTRDMVTIEPTRATMSQKSPFFGAAPTNAWVVTGVSVTPGFSWVSGSGELTKLDPPLVVKFHETGMQNLRVYVGHPWVRVDTVWLSSTQKTRPNAKFAPPLTEK